MKAQILTGDAVGVGAWHQSRQLSEWQEHLGESAIYRGSRDRNLALVERLRTVADRIGASVAQVAIAWVTAQGDDIVPPICARRRERLTEALGAPDVRLSSAHIAALKAVAGDRYPASQLAHIDSEKERLHASLRAYFVLGNN